MGRFSQPIELAFSKRVLYRRVLAGPDAEMIPFITAQTDLSDTIEPEASGLGRSVVCGDHGGKQLQFSREARIDKFFLRIQFSGTYWNWNLRFSCKSHKSLAISHLQNFPLGNDTRTICVFVDVFEGSSKSFQNKKLQV